MSSNSDYKRKLQISHDKWLKVSRWKEKNIKAHYHRYLKRLWKEYNKADYDYTISALRNNKK